MRVNPTVSIIIATKNEERHIGNLLKSIVKQTYKNIEIIVVDNNSSDSTQDLAKKFTNYVYNFGPERSTQRNFGAKKAHGKYLLFLDADMILTKNVVGKCVETMQNDARLVGLVIPEKSKGVGFWAKCKALEKSFYVGLYWMEAARFYKKSIFSYVGGYDPRLISGEDFDLSQKIEQQGKVDRVSQFIYHDEGMLTLVGTIKKKLYYAKYYAKYTKKWNSNKKTIQQISIIDRYMLFMSNPHKLLKDPFIGLGMLFMKTCEFFFGGVGYILAKLEI